MSYDRRTFQRGFDLVLTLLLIVICSPVIGWCWLRVKRSSPGPGIFRQERLGLGQQPFTIYKLRTMRFDEDEPFAPCQSSFDPRLTTYGLTLRDRKLDELPQLINVLRGDMSLVGPRPYVASEASSDPAIYRVRPGITGPGKKHGNVPRDLETQLDVAYIEQPWRPWRDVVILVQTAGFVAHRFASSDPIQTRQGGVL